MAETARDRITTRRGSRDPDKPVAKRWSNQLDGWVPEPAPSAEDPGVAYGFPGCRPIRITREEITDYEGRFEYWDADTEIAWQVCEPTSVYHELPGQELARLTERIAAVRGEPIKSYGTGDLLVRDEKGEKHVIMQPDQILYLHPHKVRRLGHAIEVGHDELPDVVLEVDLTTDVRYRKMGLYEEWGFRELWVETPENRAPSRPNRRPGVTIRVLGPHGYEETRESRAFPTWTAEEIHAALNEDALSAATVAVLRRVGRALGEQGGTGTDDDPFMRVEREQSRRDGVETTRLEMLAEALAARDIQTRRLDEHAGLIVAVPVSALMRAALACRDEADFVRRIKDATE
ncbi:MAG: hypothetical protein F4089_03965 [Gammaproteobacteria bacterium]|nr:hypothetical protein [Gammaproteobacteria bacterium]MYJ74293.1 hypothetical protein [Gammaproteobacteria bacterium]